MGSSSRADYNVYLVEFFFKGIEVNCPSAKIRAMVNGLLIGAIGNDYRLDVPFIEIVCDLLIDFIDTHEENGFILEGYLSFLPA